MLGATIRGTSRDCTTVRVGHSGWRSQAWTTASVPLAVLRPATCRKARRRGTLASKRSSLVKPM